MLTSVWFYVNQAYGILLQYDLSLDMEPAGQAVYSGVFGPAAVGEGLHFADCSTPAASGSGSVGEECRAGQSWWQDQPRPPRAPLCGP